MDGWLKNPELMRWEYYYRGDLVRWVTVDLLDGLGMSHPEELVYLFPRLAR